MKMVLRLKFFDKEAIIEKPEEDMESLMEKPFNQKYIEKDILPYWAEIWPSSIFLSRWLIQQKRQIKNKFCLDLGCGLGLSSIIAGLCGGKVIAIDYVMEAVKKSKTNGRKNKISSILWAQMDWNVFAFKPNSFHYIFGSDIIYEIRNFKPIIELVKFCLKPEGKFWICAPKRRISLGFFNMLLKNRMRFYQKGIRSINNTNIYLWEIKKEETNEEKS